MSEATGCPWWFSSGGSDADSRRGNGAGAPASAGEAAHDSADAKPDPGSNAQSLPTISLPKGGGAIRGIDEKLTIGQATGTASMTVGVFTSPARQGSGPKLALHYESGAGNGPFGLGWSLGTDAITRKTSNRLPRYADANDSDVFILSGVEDLVPALSPAAGGSEQTEGGRSYAVRAYRPRVEAGFARIERWQDTTSGEVHWRTISKDNVTSLYGQSASSRIADPKDPRRVFSWLLDLSYDDRGNAVSYVYKQEDGTGAPPWVSERNRVVTANQYLKEVRYGNDRPYLPGVDGFAGLPADPGDWLFRLVLDYGEHDAQTPAPDPAVGAQWACRVDPFSSYRAGFEIRTYRTCRRLLMFHQFPELRGGSPILVRSTDLTYTTSDAPGDPAVPSLTQLASVIQSGYVPAQAGGYEKQSLPPLEFRYQPLTLGEEVRVADPDSVDNVTGSFDQARERWIDLEGEGLQGILTEDDGAWYYKHNVSAWDPGGGPASARFAPLSTVCDKPVAPSASQLTLTDLNGDGNLCAVSFAPPTPGWFEYDAERGWGPFRSFAQTANLDFASPDLRFVDLNGDGLADVLITEDEALSWYEWQVLEGFAPSDRVAKPFDEEQGPAVVFADQTSSIVLADMTGDGLTDLVRIWNGEVCYWPNLGYCQFGAMVTMNDAPVFDVSDQFDARHIRLADIDGSGTADLVYLGSAATVWFNLSGNGWSTGSPLNQFPPVTPNVEASVFDLLGTGTACLAWTSALPGDARAPLRYIDLTAGVKPHLLTQTVNNLGATTTLTYAPSTKFYLQDRAQETPWATRLPFPVHVVERVQVDETVSGTSYVSTYSYHHGYYDGVEREFRGFARVDATDTDTLPAQSGSGTFTSLPPQEGDEFDLPPVLTKTWYHTGAYFGADDIAARLAQEYWALDLAAQQLAPTAFFAELPSTPSSTGLTAEQLREACRALRGHVLRQEIYALDGSAAQGNPYMTSEHRYEVDMVQPPAAGSYGVFYAWEREAVSYHYERNPADPRVSHELTLTIDGYGNVLRHASVGYPRRAQASGAGWPAVQSTALISYGESDYVNADGNAAWYRLGLVTESRAYELTGIALSASALLDPDRLLSELAGAHDIDYAATPDGTTVQRRLVGRHRTIYMSDGLTELPYRPANADDAVDSLGLVYRKYTLRLTQPLLGAVLGPKLGTAGMSAAVASLVSDGAFVDLDGDGSLWAPSSRLLYSAGPAPPDASAARASFYLPHGSVDPWGNIATVTYDSAHQMFVTGTRDAVGNTTQAQINFRMCAPWLMTDPNGNRTGVRCDALERVVATAVMGKLLAGADQGDHLDTTSPEAAPGDDPTTTLAYNLASVPASVTTRSRVRHRDPNTPWLESSAYTDGLGRVAMTKVEAEPAPGDPAYVPGGPVTRWVGTGKVVYDNKGHPVKAYEPFFDTSSAYTDEAALVTQGVTAITRYDPLGRAYRVDNPNGTVRKITVTPWQTITADENDTVRESAWYTERSTGSLSAIAAEASAAVKALAHADTPGLSDFDVLGRAFRTTADNGGGVSFVTTLTLDIQGHVRVTNDPRGRDVLRQDYDLAGGELHRWSADAGERWLLTNASGALLQAWDSRGFTVTTTYDPLRRPLVLQALDGAGVSQLPEVTLYGEGVPNAQQLNLCGVVYQHDDGGGRSTTLARDFAGNIVSASRELLDFGSPPKLTGEIFTMTTTYDALGRVVTSSAPDASVTTPTFNERGLLAAVSVNRQGSGAATPFVTNVSYDAKGQRQRIAYGNGAITSYSYDPETFRLTELKTTRSSDSAVLQDLAYTYDPVGNITHIADAAQQTIFYNNAQVVPDGDFTYDPTYRLTVATGRELIANATVVPPSWNDAATANLPNPNDLQALTGYTERYVYDPVGNIEQVAHTTQTSGNWTRTYEYADPSSNRLTSTSVSGTTSPYSYDAHGNITQMPHLPVMQWDWKDQLAATASQVVANGLPGMTVYRYDAAGERVTKATTNQGGTLTKQRIYLGGYEIYREYDPTGAITLERTSLHVSDAARLICLAETMTIDATPLTVTSGPATTPSTAIRFQLTNHLGSAVLELDEMASLISYEEYLPYGTTSFQAGRSAVEVSLKRYRYTGKERDHETGFYYHGARYYASWLCRWSSPDPKGLADGVNPFWYCRSNPVGLVDATGLESSDAGELAKYGLTVDEVKDYVTMAWGGMTRGDFMKKHGVIRQFVVRSRIQKVPIELINRVAPPPPQDPTVYMFPSGRQGTVAQERQRVVAEKVTNFDVGTPIGKAAEGVALLAGVDPARAASIGRLVGLAETLAPVAAGAVVLAQRKPVASATPTASAPGASEPTQQGPVAGPAAVGDPPASGGGSPVNVLVVGAETASEFDYAVGVAERGGNVTVVNPVATTEARAYQQSGGAFVQGRVEDLPPTAQFDLIREDYPFPLGRAFPVSAQFVQARLARLKPGGSWVVTTEGVGDSPEFVRTLQAAGIQAGARVTTYKIPAAHEATPSSSWPREPDRYALVFSR